MPAVCVQLSPCLGQAHAGRVGRHSLVRQRCIQGAECRVGRPIVDHMSLKTCAKALVALMPAEQGVLPA